MHIYNIQTTEIAKPSSLEGTYWTCHTTEIPDEFAIGALLRPGTGEARRWASEPAR